MTDSLSDHFIVCGLELVGRVVAGELKSAGAAFVVIDARADVAEVASILGVRFLHGVPSEPAVLRAAGVMGARALVACTDSDDENVATIIAARELCADLTIVARACGDDSEQRLVRAGAKSIVSLERAGGTDLAWRALHPSEGEPPQDGGEYRVKELTVAADAAGAGHTVAALRGGALVVGLRRVSGAFLPLPPPETRVRPGDAVMALGTPATLAPLEQLLVTAVLPDPTPAPTGLPRTTRRY